MQPTRFLVCLAAVLTLLSLALGGGLAHRHNSAIKERQSHAAMLRDLSSAWQTTFGQLEEQTTVNRQLERDLAVLTEELKAASKDLPLAENTPSASPDNHEEERRRLAELEEERDGLTRRITELAGSLSYLESQMAETTRKLEAAEGDRGFLMKELKRLQSDKAKLQQQFNDLALLREQLHTLRAERSVSRRLEWMRRGVYGSAKGGELLKKNLASAASAPANYNLEVEVTRDGAARAAGAAAFPY